MIGSYLPILIFIIVGLLVGAGAMLAGSLLSTRRPDPEKDSPYECGFVAFETARIQFDVRYYLIAILFVVFDLEIAFLFPWAVVLSDLASIGLLIMFVFLTILVIGFLYAWKKGALEWE